MSGHATHSFTSCYYVSRVSGETASLRLNRSFTQYNSRINQVGTNIRFALLSTSSNGLFVVYNTRAVTMDYVDPRNQERITLSRALLVKFTYLFDF
jgi:hypothetical protein